MSVDRVHSLLQQRAALARRVVSGYSTAADVTAIMTSTGASDVSQRQTNCALYVVKILDHHLILRIICDACCLHSMTSIDHDDLSIKTRMSIRVYYMYLQMCICRSLII